MAHMDRFNDNNYYDRKRKNQDDYSDSYKRSRPNDQLSVEEELDAAIYRLGELNEHNRIGGYSIESNIDNTSQYVLNQIIDKRSEIMSILYECISKLPEKAAIYSTLIGLLNVQNPNFVEDLISQIAANLKENIRLNQFYVFHTMFRFVSDLVNVKAISTKSMMEIYENFVDISNDKSSPQVRNDFYIYCILSSLPWNGRLLYENHGPEFDELLETIKKYLSKRQKEFLPLLKVWSNDDPHPQEDYLDLLWIQIKKLEDNDWKENQLNRPYVSFEHSFSNAIAHEFPSITPPEHNEQIIYPLPRTIFRMFDYTDVPEEFILPGAHSIERYLVEEQIHSTINTYYLDRKLCATKLLQLKLTNKIPLNYMIVEVIFAQLLALPRPTHIELFYGSLLIELCKQQPTQIPLVLAQATELFFERIDHMKTSCIERLASWFSYHISNFQFKWTWDDWKDCCLNENIESPKNKFLRETLIRCMRLSYYQRVCEFIPPAMGSVLPKNPKPTYKYMSEEAADLDGTLVANKLLELFKERSIPEDAFQILRDIPDKFNEAENEYESFNPLKIEVFTSTLLYYGHKSFSHTFAALAKYHMIFKMLVDNESSQLVVLQALHDTWKNHQQMIIVIVDKMLKTQIVECASVVKWIFSDEMKSDLTSFYVWEILHSTINRMNKQVDKLQNEYNELNQKFKKSSLDADENDEVSEEDLDKRLSTLNILKEQQEQLFLLVIQKFVEAINDKLNKPEIKMEDGQKEDPTSNPHWLKFNSDRFEDIILTHHQELLTHYDQVKAIFNQSNMHKHLTNIQNVFNI